MSEEMETSKQAESIFEKHWVKSTGKPLDEMTKQHMKYAIEAVEEALNKTTASGSLPDDWKPRPVDIKSGRSEKFVCLCPRTKEDNCDRKEPCKECKTCPHFRQTNCD